MVRKTATPDDAPAPKRRAGLSSVSAQKTAAKPQARAASEPVAKTRRSAKAAIDQLESAAKPAQKQLATKRTRQAPVAIETDAPRTKRTKPAEAVKAAFNPYAGLDDTLDAIEKHVGLSESSMESGGRLSTGNLMLDLVLGGGITAGWYTNFGQEQTCKTTGAVTIMAAAINADVPILYYWDYEGCLSFDAQVTVNGVKQGLGELFTGMNLVPYMAVDTSDLNILVDTVNGPSKVTAAMYKGPKPITKVVLENGLLLRGYKHPVLVCSVDGLLEWKYLEELAIGDNLVVQDTSASHVG